MCGARDIEIIWFFVRNVVEGRGQGDFPLKRVAHFGECHENIGLKLNKKGLNLT